jgi:hypothetical protein
VKKLSVAFTCAVLLAGCGSDDPPDYMKIAGGGLTYNYRYAEATMVVVMRQMEPMPAGGVLEALFDQPGSSAKEKISRPVMTGKLTYKLESSPLKGVKKGEPLKVVVVLWDASGKELDRAETQYISDIDQSSLPSKPPVVPGRPNYEIIPENL